MGSLGSRLKRLRRYALRFHEHLTLPGGRRVLYRHTDMLDALAASIRGRAHWLLQPIRQTDTNLGMIGLIRELERSRKRVENDGV